MQDPSIPTPSYIRRALDVFAGYGDAEAIVAADGRRYTFAQLRARTLDTAAALYHHGIRPGMTIGLLVGNPPESYFVQFGAHLLGCRTVYLVRIMAQYFLRGVLDFAGADAFVYEVATSAEAGRELAEASGLPTLCIGAGGVGPDLAEVPAVSELPFDLDAITQPPVTLFQTSGTTGTPKLLTMGERFFSAVPAIAPYYQPPDRPIRHLLGTGTWHASGQAAALLVWLSGGANVIQFGWDPDEILDKIERERVTSINVPPVVLYDLLDHPRIGEVDLSSLYRVTVSASAASPARLVQAVERFGDSVNVVYGMSELTFITALPDVADAAAHHPHRLASCGQPWGDVRLEVRAPDGAVLPTGATGEICVSSQLMTEGYVGVADPTDKRLVDGWLRTGDVGRIDEDGYVYLVARLHDVIVPGTVGENIFPRPIEDVLNGHPQVRASAVVGVPHEHLGEAVHAYVIRAPGATVTGDELRQLVVETINEAWAPIEVEFIDDFPLTEMGKVDKKRLRAAYAARVAQQPSGAST